MSKAPQGLCFDFFDTGTSRAELNPTLFAGPNLEEFVASHIHLPHRIADWTTRITPFLSSHIAPSMVMLFSVHCTAEHLAQPV
jgi:hypothetical protein